MIRGALFEWHMAKWREEAGDAKGIGMKNR